MRIQEACLNCEAFDFELKSCKRVMNAKLVVGHNGGQLDLSTHPGIIPIELEQNFADWIMDVVDAWPGWKEVARLREEYGCSAKSEKHTLNPSVLQAVH
jgi:hypothetical protein